MINTLNITLGSIDAAAKILGITPFEINQQIKKSKWVKKELNEIMAIKKEAIDMIMLDKAINGDLNACIAFLGKEYDSY